MHNRTAFFWRLGVLVLIGSLLSWWLYGHVLSILHSFWGVLPFIIFPFGISLAHNAIHAVPIWLAKAFAWVGGLWMIFTLYSFFAVIPYTLASFLIPLAGYEAFWQTYEATIAGLCGLVVIAVILRGMWQAYHPIVRDITLTSAKITAPCTIAFLTDIHFSPILSHSYARTMVRRINALHPDAVLFGGDLIDAHLDFVLRDGAYRQLENIQAPHGVWAVYGNHDYFDSSIAKEQEAFPLRFLKNTTTELPGNIALTGLNDYLHEPVNDVLPPQDGSYNILVDHEPLRIAASSRAGYDVYLGGHTHGGQFFPVTKITKRLFPLSYGKRQFGHMTAIVSSGYGFWGMPVRTGPKPEIVLLHLMPQ